MEVDPFKIFNFLPMQRIGNFVSYCPVVVVPRNFSLQDTILGVVRLLKMTVVYPARKRS